jgi:glycosyltransferase involved in cell wall biosynthesis
MGVRLAPISINRTGMNPLNDLRSMLGLRRVLRAERPEVVFSYTIKPVIYGSLAARLASTPRIFSLITGAGYAFLAEDLRQRAVGTLIKPLYRRALRQNRAVFFQNPDDLDLFDRLRLLRSRSQAVLVNGSGVDLNHFQPVPPVAGPPVFLLIARFYREKGIQEFVDAARLVKQRYPQTRFRLVGSIDSNPSAISPIGLAAWQTEGVVEHTPWVNDVRPCLAACSVFVLPSYREGTPRTVLEAMAVARPIITTNAPGCRETVVDGENGFLVPVKDPQAVARAMERFILNPELIGSMGKRARALAEHKYDVHEVNRVMLEAMGLTRSVPPQNGPPSNQSFGPTNIAHPLFG